MRASSAALNRTSVRTSWKVVTVRSPPASETTICSNAAPPHHARYHGHHARVARHEIQLPARALRFEAHVVAGPQRLEISLEGDDEVLDDCAGDVVRERSTLSPPVSSRNDRRDPSITKAERVSLVV